MKKSGNSDMLSEHKSFTTPQAQFDSSFCQTTVSRDHENSLTSGKVRENESKQICHHVPKIYFFKIYL